MTKDKNSSTVPFVLDEMKIVVRTVLRHSVKLKFRLMVTTKSKLLTKLYLKSNIDIILHLVIKIGQ